jgi:protein-L-isoaspartate O-methyltransferase
MFKYNSSLIHPAVRKAVKKIGEKSSETKLPVNQPKSHEEMITILQNFQNNFPQEVSQKVLGFLNKIPRSDFFKWGSLSTEDQKKFVTPHTFMAHPFYEQNTIPSAHQTLMRLSGLDIVDQDLKVLEIGGKSCYDAIILAKSLGDKGNVSVVEEDKNMRIVGFRNILYHGLEDKITLFSSLDECSERNSFFDRISSTRGYTKQRDVYNLLNLLEDNGLLRISLGRVGNVDKASESAYWLPWFGDLEDSDITVKDPDRNMIRTSNYTFKKTENPFEFALYEEPALSPRYNSDLEII